MTTTNDNFKRIAKMRFDRQTLYFICCSRIVVIAFFSRWSQLDKSNIIFFLFDIDSKDVDSDAMILIKYIMMLLLR